MQSICRTFCLYNHLEHGSGGLTEEESAELNELIVGGFPLSETGSHWLREKLKDLSK
jgi:hypothetical protein